MEGKLHGTATGYYKDGTEQFDYVNDTLIQERQFRKNGSLKGTRVYTYTKDTIELSTRLYRSGSKYVVERRVNGEEAGDYFIYFPNGLLKLHAFYISGTRVSQKIYDKKGRLTSHSKCQTNRENCTMTKYNQEGDVIESYSFDYGITEKFR